METTAYTTTITVADVIERLELGTGAPIAGVAWENGWTECWAHISDLSWRQQVDQTDAGGVVLTNPDFTCDACANWPHPGYEALTVECVECDRTWSGPAHEQDSADVRVDTDGRGRCDTHASDG